MKRSQHSLRMKRMYKSGYLPGRQLLSMQYQSLTLMFTAPIETRLHLRVKPST